MVFSSSAMKEYARDGDVFGAVAPQVAWGVAGLLAMLAMTRVDYRRLRLVSIPMYAIAVVLLLLVFEPSLGQTVGGSARWLKLGPLPAVHPAEFAKLALVVYVAHWLAKRGARHRRAADRDAAVPGHLPADRRPRAQGARPRDVDRPRRDRADDVRAGRRQPRPLRAARGRRLRRRRDVRPPRLPARADPGLDRPVGRPGRGSGSTRSRACSRWARAACSGSGSGRAGAPAGCSCRTRATTSSSP